MRVETRRGLEVLDPSQLTSKAGGDQANGTGWKEVLVPEQCSQKLGTSLEGNSLAWSSKSAATHIHLSLSIYGSTSMCDREDWKEDEALTW